MNLTAISQMTGLPEGLLNWLLATFGLSMLGSVWTFIQIPRRIKEMTIELREQRKLFRTRVFPKLKRIEDYLIEQEFRQLGENEELSGLLQSMRDDQYPDSDQRDAEELAEGRISS